MYITITKKEYTNIGQLITITERKYKYVLKRVKSESEEVAGCYGCFFCKLRDGYYNQTCYRHSNIGDCGSIFTGNHTILKLITKEHI